MRVLGGREKLGRSGSRSEKRAAGATKKSQVKVQKVTAEIKGKNLGFRLVDEETRVCGIHDQDERKSHKDAIQEGADLYDPEVSKES